MPHPLIADIRACLQAAGRIDAAALAPEQNLFAVRGYDSLVIVNLLMEIEKRLDLAIPAEEVLPERLDTLVHICEFVSELRGAA